MAAYNEISKQRSTHTHTKRENGNAFNLIAVAMLRIPPLLK